MSWFSYVLLPKPQNPTLNVKIINPLLRPSLQIGS